MPTPPSPATPTRYALTFTDHATRTHGFHDCATAAEVRAWVDKMLAADTPPVPVASKPASKPTKVAPSPEPSEAPVRAFLSATAPTGMEPGADTLKGRLLAFLREHGPTDLPTLRAALRRPASAINGRLSELVADGWVLRRDGRYEAAPVLPAAAPDTDADPLAARVLECLGHQPMRLGTLAQYTSCRTADLSPVVASLVKAGRVVDRGGLLRLAPARTPSPAAVKSSPVRAAPSPPPARKGKP